MRLLMLKFIFLLGLQVTGTQCLLWAGHADPAATVSKNNFQTAQALREQIQKNYGPSANYRGPKVDLEQESVDKLFQAKEELGAINEVITALDDLVVPLKEKVVLKGNKKFENVAQKFLFGKKIKIQKIEKKGKFAKRYTLVFNDLKDLTLPFPTKAQTGSVLGDQALSALFAQKEFTLNEISNLKMEVIDLLPAYTLLRVPVPHMRQVLVRGNFKSLKIKGSSLSMLPLVQKVCGFNTHSLVQLEVCQQIKNLDALGKAEQKNEFVMRFSANGIETALNSAGAEGLLFKFQRNEIVSR